MRHPLGASLIITWDIERPFDNRRVNLGILLSVPLKIPVMSPRMPQDTNGGLSPKDTAERVGVRTRSL
jgi:hypothetical protein